MSTHERWTRLLEILGEQGRIEVVEAAEALGVSTATVRRDMEELARQQLLTRTRGGAVLSGVAYDLPLRYKTARQADEKHRIARAAAGLVPPGAVVGLNGGTTTSEVARELASRADLAGHGHAVALTVVTNAINIAHELAVRPYVKTVVTGGVARPSSYELTGPLAMTVLQGISLDYAIIGVNGIDPKFGATAHDEGEADVNRAMVERAEKVIAVADSTKIGKRAFAQVCALSGISTLVTDKDAPDELVEQLAAHGVDVLCV
ncbi:DeoR/GlpR family transcriptional regulator of sugar metabolism [Kitasatospora gansuensis]|uniref:DeoR/GlpR family transcriptional regulator of sugar metabolism n=1 Tax=Kitasatospora gansuensis TaxID=258050 RepID=A0A7W7WJU2_9ACTN|nr:DeoR/GlpR family DNA-binding transcription regulator [Kitasatospora gansuensis]MBB4948989.1 DeoR/GlpR family transcriptional regulator of sugar metabolism [Kitasatospora gansuensis]